MRRAARVTATFVVAGLVVPVEASSPTPLITARSNRGDLVSGGDVLIEVSVPRGEPLVLLRGRQRQPVAAARSGDSDGNVQPGAARAGQRPPRPVVDLHGRSTTAARPGPARPGPKSVTSAQPAGE